MNASRFDRLTRSLGRTLSASPRSRRQTLIALGRGTLVLVAMPEELAAGPGCKNVGRKCKRAKQCCSGICTGKKGKKRCRAHDTGGCQAGQKQTVCGGTDASCTSSTGFAGSCDTTTGNAGYCTVDGKCFACGKDADCRPFCGPRAACVRCELSCALVSGGTVCAGPSGGSCTFPP